MNRTAPSSDELEDLWARHHAEWRDPAQIASQWAEAQQVDPDLLQFHVSGAWWETLAGAGITLLVTREYEHLVMALGVREGKPSISYYCLPHPSGLVVDRARMVVHIASTRNPNQVYDLRPVDGMIPRRDVPSTPHSDRPLVPIRSRYYPGSLYMHDLAIIDGALHANAVGENAVIRLHDDGRVERVWWPRATETPNGPIFDRNHLQLNSIAAGPDLAGSYFSASTDKISVRRPGHRNFPVDRRGVIFSGATREPMVRGLTRPHSARLFDGRLWVDNSGYGTLCTTEQGQLVEIAQLPGWTRGLCFHERVAFVGTSRVIPRFRQYAPGLDPDRSICALHALDTTTGKILGSLIWPYGNQIFAIDWLPDQYSSGFPFAFPKRSDKREKALFYAFQVNRALAEGR